MAATKKSRLRKSPPIETLESRVLLSTVYVDAHAPGTVQDGMSWATAYTDLQAALVPAGSGTEIHVADGTYKPTSGTDRAKSFVLKNGVSLFGGYAGHGAADPNARDIAANPAILSGNIGSATSTTDNSFHVVVGSGSNAAAVLDGFTISAGSANGSSGNQYGAGMYTSAGNPIVINCTFSGNTAYSGGGMYNASSSPTLTNCTFIGNIASISGGGAIYNIESAPTLMNCAFTANAADESGGGICNRFSSSPALTNCTFSGNSAYNYGGAIYSDSSSLTLINSSISGNTANSGGGIYLSSSSVTMTNCTIVGDNAFEQGCAVYNYHSSSELTNCIVWGCGGSPIYNYDSSTTTIQYSDIQGGDTGIGNLDVDPGFVRSGWTGPDGRFGTADDDYGDLRLRTGSLASNAGSNSAIPAGVTTDLDGNSRLQDGTVDMGAYEGCFTAPAPKLIYVDINAVGAGNGTSWMNAFTSLSSAILAASDGDTIRVADGTYTPTTTTDRALAFNLKGHVSLYGGYAGNGSADPDARNVIAFRTMLSGDIGVTGSNTDNSFHVVIALATSSATVDGLVISQGNANGYQDTESGGGFFIRSSRLLTVTGCTVTGNTASGDGAGIYDYSSTLMLTNCTFSANSAPGKGGGISSFSSSLTMSNCIFSGNSAYRGGGMFNDHSSPLTLSNCIFNGNAGDCGGAIANYYSPTTLINCTFIANSSDNAGAMYNVCSFPTLINCTFSGNTASSGGAIYNMYSSPRLTNCIVWGCGASPISFSGNTGSAIATYSDIQFGCAGVGNVDAEPRFVRSPWTGPDGVFGTADDDYGDLRLRADSPALDKGSNSAIPAGISTDLAGNPRIHGGTADMGAYEGSFAAAAPKLIYVDLNAVGAGTGTRWADAFTSLSLAILASNDGDTIRVADGTYTPTSGANRTLSFALKYGMSLYGGYAGNGNANPNARNLIAFPTILSGDLGAKASSTDNSYHVVTAVGIGGAVVDGVTITRAYADGGSTDETAGAGLFNRCSLLLTISNCIFSSNTTATSFGGGMSNFASSPTITNCTFTGNSTLNGGGGVYNYNSSPTLIDCTFNGNTAYAGAGMYNENYSSPALINCGFSGNASSASSPEGAGGMYNSSSSSPTLTNCAFSGNSASHGGGMYNSSSSSPTLTNCTFSGNSASEGGGIYNNFSASPILTNCSFSGNSASDGGGVYISSSWTTLTNCSFSGNSASNGGGIYNYYASLTLINSTFSGNTASYGGGIFNVGSSSNLANCIVWRCGASPIYNNSPTATITYSDIEYGYTGVGNINVDPLFIDADGPDNVYGTADDNLRLQAGSPCINTGSNAAIPAGLTTDMDGNGRIINGTVDMGAYERQLNLAVISGSFSVNGASPSVVFALNNVIVSSTFTAGDVLIQSILPDGSFGATVSATSADYDPSTRSITIALPINLADANYRATLLEGSVSDAYGSSPVVNYSFDFFVLGGDANRDRIVDAQDLGAVSLNWNKQSGATFSQGDFNYDGRVDVGDLLILANNWQKKLDAPAAPVAPAPAPVAPSAPVPSSRLAPPARATCLRPAASVTVAVTSDPVVQLTPPLVTPVAPPRRSPPARVAASVLT